MQSLQNELAHAMQHLMQSDAISGSQQGGVASQTEGEDSAYEDPEVTSAGGGAS
jgi:hypothetical protein